MEVDSPSATLLQCPICVETFNKATRKAVTCPYCPTPICMACHRTYLLNTVEQPHCMQCRTAWPLDTCYALLPKTFWAEYEVKRAEWCLAQEKNLLPETMLEIQRENVWAQLKQRTYTIQSTAGRFHNFICHTVEPSATLQATSSVHYTNDLVRQIEEYLLIKVEYDALCLPADSATAAAAGSESDAPVSSSSVECYLPCPAADCHGYTNNRGKCGLCEQRVCTRCRMPKPDGHVCQVSDVASVDLIKRDCRPCPQCRASIHRYEGCPQMFCTACHAKFDWHTGRILTNIHNPHLTEWLMAHGQPPEPTDAGVCNVRFTAANLPEHTKQAFREYYDRAVHLYRFEIPALENNHQNRPIHNLLRRQYLQQALTEKDWINELKLYNRRAERTREIVHVLETFHGVALRVIRDVIAASATSPPSLFDDALALLNDVTDTTNQRLTDLSLRYKISITKYIWNLPNDVMTRLLLYVRSMAQAVAGGVY